MEKHGRSDDPAAGEGPARRAPGGPPAPRAWSSEELLGDAPVALIRHAGRVYQLRRTRTGKLILT